MPIQSISASPLHRRRESRQQFIDRRQDEIVTDVQARFPEDKAGVSIMVHQADDAHHTREAMQDLALEGTASETAMASNVPFEVMKFSYGTGKPMQAWLKGNPPGGKLELKVTITPSGHDGPNKARAWAAENTYHARVGYMEGHRFVELDKTQFDSEGLPTNQRAVQKNKPYWAVTSPKLTVDLNAFRKEHPGKELVLEGWPSFSIGTNGYREARRTMIDVSQ